MLFPFFLCKPAAAAYLGIVIYAGKESGQKNESNLLHWGQCKNISVSHKHQFPLWLFALSVFRLLCPYFPIRTEMQAFGKSLSSQELTEAAWIEVSFDEITQVLPTGLPPPSSFLKFPSNFTLLLPSFVSFSGPNYINIQPVETQAQQGEVTL